LADEALRIVSSAPLQENPSLICSAQTFELPVESPLMLMLAKNSPMAENLTDKNNIKTTVNLLTIGNARVLTIPGEALPNIGFYLKRKMNTDNPFLFGLTNDAFGYILSKEDFNSFERYEYISRTSLGEHTGEAFVDQALKMIESQSIH